MSDGGGEAVAGGIGAPLPGLRWRRLLAGRGRYVADLAVRGTREAAFVRSPHAHAGIRGIDVAQARAMPGVDAVFTAADLAAVLSPWRGAHALMPDLVAPSQSALATERVRHVGEPVAMVVGADRATCEDAAERVEVDYAPLPPLADPEAAVKEGAPALHEAAPDNVCVALRAQSDGVAEAFAGAHAVVEATFRFGRHTGIPLETRGLVADFDPVEKSLLVHHSHQCPAAMQDAFARLLGLAEHRVRVVCPDVGGGFGIKQQVYADEMAVVAASVLLGRPVRFLADRVESMTSDIQARHHVVTARLAVDADGRLCAFEADDMLAIGAYSQYPRSSAGEGRAMLTCTAAPYAVDAIAVRSRAVFTNLGMAGHYRGVGHPIAAAVTEGLVDLAARRLGIDPWQIRRQNFVPPEAFPYTSPVGVTFERQPFHACLDALAERFPAADLDAWRVEAAGRGVLAGVGIAAFVEMTSRGPAFYGDGNVNVSTRDGCTLRLEPSGLVRGTISVTEQGQGVETGVTQIVASALGVPVDHVALLTGDTAVTDHGGGTWGSRSAAIGGHAAWVAARRLRAEILAVAAALLQTEAAALDVRDGAIVSAADGCTRLSLAELAATCHFRPHHVPGGRQAGLVASAVFGPLDAPFRAGCGVQLSMVEIDPETGIVRPVRHAVAHSCGLIVNPLMVDGQLKGGIVQGLGAALTEELVYDLDGQLLSGSLAEYKVPMAGETPDIDVLHVHAAGEEAPGGNEPPRLVGVGEAGTAGASAAVMNAVNDALAARGAALFQIPATPQRVLAALGVIAP